MSNYISNLETVKMKNNLGRIIKKINAEKIKTLSFQSSVKLCCFVLLYLYFINVEVY